METVLLLYPATPMAGIAIVASFSLFCYLLFASSISIKRKSLSKKIKPPECGRGRPFLGHLHLLGGPKPAHLTLGDLAEIHGPIFTIRMGIYPTLVISNWELAKECLNTNNKTFVNRPKSLAAEILGYNYAMFGFSPYGPYWLHIRKTIMQGLLSNQRLEKLSHVRESEMKTSIKQLHMLAVKKVVVELKRWFWTLYLNMVFKMVIGKRYTEIEASLGNDETGKRRRKALRDFFDLTGAYTIADALPYLRWLDLRGYEKAMKTTAKELDTILEEHLEEHKQKRNYSCYDYNSDGELDFMDLMCVSLLKYDDAEAGGYDADTINKSTCMAIILGSIEATTVTAVWAISLLLNNPNALRKAQHELDTHIGRERHMQESDIKNLVYLQAIIKETMRLYPGAPLSIPRESVEDCTVGGYHIPAGTRLLINLSKLQRDPTVWSNNADEFQPERFLTTHKHVDVKGQNYELIPFGAGRRVCPGASLALQVIQIGVASLLHAFEITSPSNEPIDMSESPGLTNLKASPLEVLLKPRLPPHLYE